MTVLKLNANSVANVKLSLMMLYNQVSQEIKCTISQNREHLFINGEGWRVHYTNFKIHPDGVQYNVFKSGKLPDIVKGLIQ